jgi:hypothetical protein
MPHRSFEKLLLQRPRMDEASNKEMYYARCEAVSRSCRVRA